ncbi:vomeronasal type-2 receptor 26-like [Leptodactylus fuscus]|uniref:vomeronasal type-2 receptor 26-like n=1 Tax=Leptodactylus fuscus TaxID=238119 RepID=UPI003F4F15BC
MVGGVVTVNSFLFSPPNNFQFDKFFSFCALKAIQSILQILSGSGKIVPNYFCTKKKVVGFIGDHFSSTTLPIAQLLGIYPYTQISYGTTDPLLSDRDLFPSFFRTVPDDYKSYSAIFQFLRYFQWSWVGIISSDDNNGRRESGVLTKILTRQKICVAYVLKSIYTDYRDKNKDRKIARSMEGKILDMKSYFKSSNPLKNPQDKILEMFLRTENKGIPWRKRMEELYTSLHKKDLHERNGTELLETRLLSVFDERTSQIYLAVRSLATGLSDMYGSCGHPSTDWLYQHKHKVHNYIEAMMCTDESGVEHKCFTEEADKDCSFAVNNPIVSNSSIVDLNKIPTSRCSASCLPGDMIVATSSMHFCCYGCAPCSEGKISNVSDSRSCMKCPEDSWPNENRTFCILKKMEYLSYTEDIMSIVFICLSSFFCILTILIFVLFYSKRDTPIVRANNKNLSFVLLVSITLSFLCVFLFLGRPVDITCMLRQISAGILLSVSVSSLLAKTIMVCIAFKATKPGSVWITWTGVKFPNSVLLICSSVQVVLCMSWVTLSPPFQELDIHSYKKKTVVQCNEGSDLWFYSVLGYMGILAAVSFIIAFLVRTLPDSFNEAKYITFSMLVFCSVWIAMIPAYLSTKGKYMVVVEIFAILTSSAGLLGCIFVPKCYIILFKPELNMRKHLLGPKIAMLQH